MPVSEVHDFPLLAETRRKDMEGRSLFALSAGDEEMVHFGFQIRQGEAACLQITSPSPLKSPGAHFITYESEDKFHYLFPKVRNEADLAIKAISQAVKPPLFEAADQPARPSRIISPEKATELIYDHDPRNVVFYTGAGISNAGEHPIPDHPQLTNGLKFIDNEHPRAHLPESDLHNRRFIDEVLKNESLCAQSVAVYQQFLDGLFYDASTPAHIAIANLVRSVDLQPAIFTTNYDLRHEGFGSRLAASKVTVGWHAAENYGLSEQKENEREQCRNLLLNIGSQACLLMVIGVANDRRGVIRYFSSLGADILAINNSNRELSYPSTHQVRDDAQTVLPSIMNAFAT